MTKVGANATAREIAKAFALVRTATNEKLFDVQMELAVTKLPLEVHQRLFRTLMRGVK